MSSCQIIFLSLSHTISLKAARGKKILFPSSPCHKAARAWNDTCLFPTGKEVHLHKSSSRRHKRKEQCEKKCRTISIILKFILCDSLVSHKKTLLSFLPPSASPTFPGWWVSRRQKWKYLCFSLWNTGLFTAVNFKIITWTT